MVFFSRGADRFAMAAAIHTYLAALVGQQLLQVGDAKVGHANVARLARGRELLHLAPGVDKVPVRHKLGVVVWVRRRRPVHEVQVDVVGAQVREALVQRGGGARLVRVVELGREPDGGARHARRLDARADLLLVAVCCCRVDVAVAAAESGLDGLLDFAGFGLPCSQADGGDFGSRVERVCAAARFGSRSVCCCWRVEVWLG